jgi:hypothetical protein
VTADRGRRRPVNLTRWEDVLPAHDVVLTRADLEEAPPGAVFSVEARFGPNPEPVHISVERRQDGMWTVHTRAHVPSEALIGGNATPRRRVSRLTGEEVPHKVSHEDNRRRTSFAQAVERITRSRVVS